MFRVKLLLALPCLAAVLFVFILPYGAALGSAFGGGLLSVWENRSLPAITLFTLKQAFFSVLVSLAIGLPGAWFLGHSRPLLRSVSAIPFAMPSILVVLGFVLFWGNAGWLNQFIALFPGMEPLRILYRPEAIVLAHGFLNFPLVIRLAGDGMARAKMAYGPAAANLGASPLMRALTVVLPLAFPAIMSAALLVFLYSFTSFAVVLVLGGGPASTTLAVEIFRHARIFLNYQNAGALALAETLIAVLVFLAYVFFSRRSRAIKTDIQDTGFREKRSPAGLVLMLAYGLFLAVFILGPLLSIVVESLLERPSRGAGQFFSVRWWSSLGDSSLPALFRSLLLAFLSATTACFLAIGAAASLEMRGGIRAMRGIRGKLGKCSGIQGLFADSWANLLKFFAAAPLISSGIVLGLGWMVLYGRSFARAPWVLVLLHAVIALPFAFNSISEGFRSLPAKIMDAAANLGAGPLRSLFTIAIPLSLKRIRSAWGFAAALSLGELNAVMMLGMEGWETLPLYIYRAAGAYRYGAACAAGSLLMLCCAACFLLSEVSVKTSAKPSVSPLEKSIT
ncbi:MAG: iron ABC transporter permease [Treponema sp.]|nr:iron ABC transporter permease [Treponema sp.]